MIKSNWLRDLLLLSISIGLFFSLWLGSHPLLVPDEGRYSEVAREMLVTGDYVTPHLDGTVLLDKPVLFYWLQVSAMKLFGINEWALRFWPALLGILGCLFTYVAGRQLYDRCTGVLAAIILATSPLYFGLAHYANLDMGISIFITGSLFSFLIATKQEGSRSRICFLYAAYIFAGLALLTKGLIGLIFPILIIGLWIFLTKQWRLLLHMHIVRGLLLVIAIAMPWYLLVQHANPTFFQHFFIGEQFTRYLSKHFNNQQPFWFYVPVVLLGFFPWSLLLVKLPSSFPYAWEPGAHSRAPLQCISSFPRTRESKFLLVWPLVIIIFFSIPNSKTISYVLPAIPPFALLVSHYLSINWHRVGLRKLVFISITIMGLLLITISATARYASTTTTQYLALQLSKQLQPTDEVISYYRYYYDLPFYLQRQVSVVSDWNSPQAKENDSWEHELWQGSQNSNATIVLLDNEKLLKKWHDSKRLYIFVDASSSESLKHILSNRYFVLGRYDDITLISNKS